MATIEMGQDDSDEYRASLAALKVAMKRQEQHSAVIMGNALDAAKDVHIAMCQLSRDDGRQPHLKKAMHSILIIAEECRQGWLLAAREDGR
jgi:hypothetical protein